MTADGGLPPLPYEQWDQAAKDRLPGFLRRPERYGPGRAPMPRVLGLFAHHVDLGAAWMGFTETLAGPEATLDPRLRELAILRVAWRTRCAYEWLQHARIGRAAGLDDQELAGVARSPDAGAWTPVERAVLEAVDQVVARAAVDGPTWAALAADLEEAQLLELLFVIGGYLCFSAVVNSVGLAADPPTEPVPPLPGPDGA